MKGGPMIMAKLENEFQPVLIKDLETMFPGCIVMKNDANYIQGIPDLTVLYNNRWAVLECKRSKEEYEKCFKTNRPANQRYYVDKLNTMSFSRYIYPENKEEVLNDLQQAFGA